MYNTNAMLINYMNIQKYFVIYDKLVYEKNPPGIF